MGNDDSKPHRQTRRRSTRILLRVPLLVNSVDRVQEEDWEQVETVMVSQHGGLIRTRRGFPVGTTLEIRMRAKERTARARVAWKSATVTPQGIELGFEILDYPGFWEITFPPDSWSVKVGSEKS